MKLKTIVLTAAMMLATPVMAQDPICWDRNTFIQIMEVNEAVNEGRGITVNGLMYEIWVRDGGEWMSVFTTPEMITCVGAHGLFWEEGYTPPRGVPG
jgi:hypothetical protein